MDYNRPQNTQAPTPAAQAKPSPAVAFVQSKTTQILNSKVMSKKLAVYIVAGFLGLIIIPEFLGNIFSPVRRTVSVVGLGQKSITPEKASISFSLVVSANSKQQAIQDGDAKFEQIISGLSKFNPEAVNKSSFQITQSGISTSNNTLGTAFQYSNAAEITVSNTQNIKDLSKYLHESGATLVGQIRYIPKDQDKTNAEVRDLAIRDAREKASKMASSAGAALGRVVTITEGNSNSQTGTPITGTTKDGEEDINIQSIVTITYELK